MLKSPINWVGNKYKYLDIINDLTKGKKYNYAIDMFMGSGNIILNLECECGKYIGLDKVKLVPKLYTELGKYNYELEDVENILNRFGRFSKKEDYYTFRDYWNKKYLSDNFDKQFIVETVLLLKMCSNSMVRFNTKEGYFNQGFRGLGKKKEFFTETMKLICVEGLNKLSKEFSSKKYTFIHGDFMNYEDDDRNGLLLLDPPYILRKDMYDTIFSEEHDRKLLDIISNTKNDFIYFNYIIRDGVTNNDLKSMVDKNDFKVIEINNKTLAGQGRSKNIKNVSEVLITNIRN